jgi:hypothetical protein
MSPMRGGLRAHVSLRRPLRGRAADPNLKSAPNDSGELPAVKEDFLPEPFRYRVIEDHEIPGR